MSTPQQQEALQFFREHAERWRARAQGVGNSGVNIIEQRNDYVQQVAQERPSTRSFLDVACGTGELVCTMAKRGIDATGVDFAPEMIELSYKKARSEGLDRAKFICGSIFTAEIQHGAYDLISSNGFIEYVSLQEMQSFFTLVREALAPQGSFVVSSRNRLFNILSMNDYTRLEMRSGDIAFLFREALGWASGKEISELMALDCVPFQAPDTRHAYTDIGVATRYQYSPLQLVRLLKESGFKTVELYPVHIHGVPLAFKESNPDIHGSVANLLQTRARHNTQLLTHASTFMVHVKRD